MQLGDVSTVKVMPAQGVSETELNTVYTRSLCREPGAVLPLGWELCLEPCESAGEFTATTGLSHPCTSLGGNAWKPEPPHYTGGPGVTQGQGRPSLKGSYAFPAAQGLKLHAAGLGLAAV